MAIVRTQNRPQTSDVDSGGFWQSDQERSLTLNDQCPQVNLAAFGLRDTVFFCLTKTNNVLGPGV